MGERERAGGSDGGGGGDGASDFSRVESACACDARVDGVGRARSPRDGTFEQFQGCQGHKVFWGGGFVSLTSAKVTNQSLEGISCV